MKNNQKNFVYTLLFVLSMLITAFLVWFIYFKPAATTTAAWVVNLPFVNATLNSISAMLLVAGYIFIKKKDEKNHIRCMSSALVTSALFLVSYLLYHHYHGDTKFIAQGSIRYFYFTILITHIILSVAMLPMILITLWNAFTSNLVKHKFWAKLTLPIWLYVSVTGVIIVVLVKFFNY
jgi:putative membrane protein